MADFLDLNWFFGKPTLLNGVACTFALGLLMPLDLTATSPSSPSNRQVVVVEVEDLRSDPENGLTSTGLYFTLHDGEFDLYDYHRPASDALTAFINWFGLGQPVPEFFPANIEFGEQTFSFGGFETTPDFSGVPPEQIAADETFLSEFTVMEPAETPYFSFFSRIHPGDDLFIGNEDPKRYRVFDEVGQFTGPLVIDVYGSDLLDAGVRENLEQDLLYYDRASLAESELLLRTEQNVVRPHPGFIGSSRNQASEPGRLLSNEQSFCFPSLPLPDEEPICLTYNPMKLDFTQPEYPLFRIRVTASSRYIHGGWSGTYFDPARDGEGFSFEFLDENPDRVTMFWYTYKDDQSGEQNWLIGQGEKVKMPGALSGLGMPDYEYEIKLFTTEGGRLTSTDNPDSVELIEWGSARLGISESERADLVPACQRLRLFDIRPLDESIVLNLPVAENGLPEYELVRLGALLSGVESICANATAFPELSSDNNRISEH